MPLTDAEFESRAREFLRSVEWAEHRDPTNDYRRILTFIVVMICPLLGDDVEDYDDAPPGGPPQSDPCRRLLAAIGPKPGQPAYMPHPDVLRILDGVLTARHLLTHR